MYWCTWTFDGCSPSFRRVVLLAYRDDNVQRFVAEAVEQRSENAEVSVVNGAERDVDDRQAGQRVQPRELGLRWLSLDRTDALHCARNRFGYLKARWAHVEIQVAVEATKGVRRETV